MKKLFALLAGAVLGFGVVAAEAAKTDERTNWNSLPLDTEAIQSGVQNPNQVIGSTSDNDALLKALAEVKSAVLAKEASIYAKRLFVHAEAVMFARTHRDASYDEVLAKLDEACVEFGLVNYKEEGWYHTWKVLMMNNCWYAGNPNVEQMKQCIEKFKADPHSDTQEQLVSLQMQAGYPVEQWLPQAKKSIGGKRASIARLLTIPEQVATAAELYWDLALGGQLSPSQTVQQYQQVISYELTKEGYNAEELKSKIHRVITVYKIKARTWKATKEGEENPWINFVGALTDTLNDL